MSDDDVPLTVEELADYCQTQARFLWGHIETMDAETDELLDEIDEDIAEVRARLAQHEHNAEVSTASPMTAGPDAVAELQEREAKLEEKQAVVEAKQARMAAFQDLAAAYVDLSEDLNSTTEEGKAALDRVVRFERDRDAPAYFDDRQTVLEAATAAGHSPET